MRDRTVQLIRKFIVSDFPISIENLSEEFLLSHRTIQNEIKILNSFLQENNFTSLETIRGKGLKLSISKKQKGDLVSLLGKSNTNNFFSREERLLDLILSVSVGKEKVFLFKKEEEFQISKSTLDEDMRRLRLLIKEYGIEVMSIPKQGLVLNGNERNIRTMIYSFINNTVGNFTLTDQLKNETTKQQIIFKYISLELLREIDQIYDEHISASEDNFYRKNLVIFTGIWLTRFQNKKSTLRLHLSKKKSYASPEIKAYVNSVFAKFDLEPAENERHYLTIMLETFNSKNMSTLLEWVQAQMLSIQLIQHVEKETHIPFTKKEEELQEGLYQHIGSLLNRVRNNVQFSNPLKDNIKLNYESIYKAVESFSEVFTNILGKSLTDDEIAFLTIHFSTSLSELNQESIYFYRAVVICNHGIATGKLLSENLKELFNIEVLAVLSSRETELIEKLDVDLVFSTVPIDIPTNPYLIVDPIIKEDSTEAISTFLKQHRQYRRLSQNRKDSTTFFSEILNLFQTESVEITAEMYRGLESIFKKNHLPIDKKELQPMIQDILKDENILINVEAEDWEALIKIVAQPLLKEKAVTNEYVTAMIDAVEQFGPYIVIGEHLALAHARPEDGVNRLGFSVATVKNNVEFGHEDNDPVKVIFCLSAIDSFSHLNIMRGLIELINDKSKIEELTKAKTKTEFKNILFS